jgi:hypothetical protein
MKSRKSRKFVFDPKERGVRVPNRVMIQGLITLAKKYDRPPTMQEWNAWRLRPCNAAAVRRRFGTWKHTLRAAGFNVPEFGNHHPEDLMRLLEKAWRTLGRPPANQSFRIIAGISGHVFWRWGGIAKACDALAAYKRRRITRHQLLNPPPRASRMPLKPGLRFRVFERDNHKCVICGRGAVHNVQLHVDHIIPVCKGGPTEYDNLRVLCAACNRGKISKDRRAAA